MTERPRVWFLQNSSDRLLPDEFLRETRELMLRRARIGIILGSCIQVAFIAVDALRVVPERFPQAAAARLIGGALLLSLLAVARMHGAVRWAPWIGAIALAILMVTTASIIPLFQGVTDPQYAVQGTGLVLCVLGGGLLLPFDGPKMLGLGLLALAVQVGFTLDFPLVENLPILVSTLASIPIAVVGAHQLTRSRLADFEGRRAKEELVRTRSDFVAMLTHDIKNPLSVIRGYAQVLREEPDMALTERDELLAAVERAAGNAISLASNFLDASKVEAGRFELKRRIFDVRQVLRQAVSDQRPLAEHKGVRLVEDGGIELPSVDADPAALERVIANLVGNALKHTPAGGTVRVASGFAAGNQIEIVVEDTGEGIAPGQESRIFDRYTSAASRADSTGLGLFIARTITSAHGGTIVAENRLDRPGARFRVTLPAG